MKQLYTRCQAALLCLAFLFFAPGLLFSQKRTLTAYPNTIVDSYIHGFYTSLPASYNSGSKKYPLLIFIHGIGEIGDGSAAALPAVLRNGPPMQINYQVNKNTNANFPDPVTVNGQSFEFIVVCPQLNTWAGQVAVNDMINYAIRNYRVDTGKIYLTGLSMGGGIAWEYPGYSAAMYGKRLAGLLVVAGASTPVIQRADEIVKAHLPVWATANSVDPTVPPSYTTDYIKLLNQEGANPAPWMTIFPDQGHGGWVKTYGAPGQPGVVQNGLNVYQWMLQYKREGDNVVIDKPSGAPTLTVNAGGDQTIALPNRANLTGSATATNSTVSSYKWAQVSGPAIAYFNNSGAPQTQVTGLVAGTYVFKLTATGSTGLTASDQVTITATSSGAPTITVNAGADQTITLPSRANLAGSATATNTTIASYKWTQVSGPAIAYFNNSGAAQTQATGLIAGTYVFKLTATGATGLIASDQLTITTKTAARALTSDSIDAGGTITLYPNPVQADQQFVVEGRGWQEGTLKFLIYDMNGKVVKQLVLENTTGFFRQSIPVTGLAKGAYVLAITREGERPKTFKLMVE
ncbi:MAG TPA: T9SS type A sorting domain-containing protein [Puia sp.]|nr:T9SS type A sorting domain-containing protein [Puia sp.]